MKFIQANNITIHYRRIPSDKSAFPLVFVNSLGTDFRLWEKIIFDLRNQREIIFYDKRGHGLSDSSDNITMDDHVNDLIALLETLTVKKAVICGLSVGGLIAQGLYSKRPDLCAALILSNTGHKIGTTDAWNQRIKTVLDSGIEPIADMVLERWFSKAFRQNSPAKVAGFRNMLIRTPVSGYAGTSRAIRDTDFTESAKNIKVPVLCVAGSEDGSTPPELLKQLSDLIPGSRYTLIDGVGHLPCVEKPIEFSSNLVNFFKDI